MQRTPFLPRDVDPLILSFVQKNACCSKTLVWLSRFRNCLEKVRSSNSDRDRAKRVIGIAHWSPKCNHSSRAVKVGAKITQFRSELSRTWSVGTVWALETKIEPHFVQFMPFSCLHPPPLTRSTTNWALRKKYATETLPSKGRGSFDVEFYP